MSLKTKLKIRLAAAESRRLAAEALCERLVGELVGTLGNKRSNFDVTGIKDWVTEHHKAWITTLIWRGSVARYNVLSLYVDPTEGVVYLKTYLDKAKYRRLIEDTDTCLDIVADTVMDFIKSRALHMTPAVIGESKHENLS